MPVTLVRNIAQIATALGGQGVRGRDLRRLSVLHGAVVVIREGRFGYLGPENGIPSELRAAIQEDVDAEAGTLLPGFVDSHTHLPFAGSRETEFNRRLQGESYSEIASAGGGILSSVQATRAVTEQDLVSVMRARTLRMAEYGTTTAEAKSGYGLRLEDEIKQLRAIRSAAPTSAVRLVPTCLAAHEFPADSRASASLREEYVRQIIAEILPAVARERLAKFCDVFVEDGVFTRAQGERILRAGQTHGLKSRIHADELSDTGGADLAVSLDAASADHLMYVSKEGIRRLASSDTVANLLPATSFFLMSERYAPARALIDAGAIVSLSTDCNPGSSMTESMQIVLQLACLKMKMTVEEALTAATINGAYSLGLSEQVGSIEQGKRADFFILDAPNYLHLVYHFGVNLISSVYRDGERVWNRSRSLELLRRNSAEPEPIA